jgi:alkanesulfonate monooxygenase SsuD/methylene tetrahydromethanopterin reductase-like flavin-dependent oxidoreductase (luciferase family)
MPVQQPIPIWLGGSSRPAYERMGRLADGWFPQVPPGPKLEEAKEVVAAAARGAGREPATIGMEGRVGWSPEGGPDRLADHVQRWRDAGATHLTVSTMGVGLGGVDGHVRALEQAAGALGLRR